MSKKLYYKRLYEPLAYEMRCEKVYGKPCVRVYARDPQLCRQSVMLAL